MMPGEDRQDRPSLLESLNITDGSVVPGLILPGLKPRTVGASYYLGLYCAVVAVSFGLPFLTALLMRQSLYTITVGLRLPFLRDYNVVFMSLVSLPCLFLLAVREQRLVPDCLSSLLESGVARFGSTMPDQFQQTWERRFRSANRRANILGVIAAVVASAMSASATLGGARNTGPGGPTIQWQTFGAPSGLPNAAGWMFFLLQEGPFWFLLTTHVFRELYVGRLLTAFVQAAPLKVEPLHPDRAGGLHPVTRLALHYQIVIATLGLNIGPLLVTAKHLGRGTGPEVAASLILYLVLTPLAFLRPLLPFRSSMIAAKRQVLARISSSFSHHLDGAITDLDARGSGDSGHVEAVQKLRSLHDAVRAFPEWPFDIGTMKRFTGILVSPLYSAGFSLLCEWLFH
jgi:hypothetical protein